jgi:hypothetical protein
MFRKGKIEIHGVIHEFKDVFAWSYEDLCGFDPNVIQHAIPIKEEEKLVRKRQRPYQSCLGSYH